MKYHQSKYFFLFSEVDDIQQLLRLIDPTSFGLENDKYFDEGLLQMKLDEPVKLQLCYILQHLSSYQLQYRIESIIAFSEEFVGRLQTVSFLFILFYFKKRNLSLKWRRNRRGSLLQTLGMLPRVLEVVRWMLRYSINLTPIQDWGSRV
jgi:hypothetical protein